MIFRLIFNEFGNHCLPKELTRETDANLPQCDEMTVVRHYTNHSANNFGVDNGFYPLGSCTMKYNPSINEEMANLPAFSCLHPMQPEETVAGAKELERRLIHSLCELTGMADFTLKPFAGAHGELTGLMIIRSYHESRNDIARTKVIVPDSAHGTNLGEQLLLIARCRWCSGLLLLLAREHVDGLDQEKNAESDDDKVDERLDEVAIVDRGGLHLLHTGDDHAGQCDFQVGEVHAADQPSDRWHDDVVDNTAHDLTKCTADDHTDSHVHCIASDGKILELLNKFTHNNRTVKVKSPF